ncbi:hypothetical protein O181_021653 [Austropuccinia psidii MF-1]|uniref:GAG-pre-integrase domain-containing protein n=1 Tax=Austropuccinia psidii MF-1 TaxID=1389203 RepID=A0A9Q3CDR7_9BASI|nr:hypothetical protein [Austropuccinia psidii MF-1]
MVSEELQGILLENDDLFFMAWNTIGDACGKNSTVTICQALTRLTSLFCDPGSSLDHQIDTLLKLYASYKYLVGSSSTKIELSKEMDAAFFLQILDRDRDLSSLVQNLYDANQGNQKKASGSNKSPMTPNQGENDSKRVQNNKNKRRDRTGNQRESVSKWLEKLEKLLLKNTLSTLANAVTSTTVTDQKIEKEHGSSDSDAYYISSEGIFATKYKDRQTLYLDNGCGQSVVNNLTLLSNVTKVNKNIKTFGSSVEVAHQGAWNMFGCHISPMSYAPQGPVNLISVSQLVDNGIKPHYKNEPFLIKRGSSVVAAFTRDENLYSNQNQSQVNLTHPNEEKDWHTLMGHPNDKYLECLLTQLEINEHFTSSKNCKICSRFKIQQKTHKSILPLKSKTFFKIHSETLEILPTTRRGHRYILVLINDYTRFN